MTKNITTKNPALIISLCKDIARHTSQLEAEIHGVEQDTNRYLELKNLLTSHYWQGEDNFENIIKEIRRSMNNCTQVENIISVRNHLLCMLDYFLMLTNEMNKN